MPEVTQYGAIKVQGGRAHLFYAGPVANHRFTNFELKAKVRTTPGSNSGIYFHTEFQDRGWPARGYECQVNNTHKDRRKTASLYAVKEQGTFCIQAHDPKSTVYIKDIRVTVLPD